jgi:hypothetical protein
LPIAADLAATTAAAASINSAAVLFSRAGAGHFSRAPKARATSDVIDASVVLCAKARGHAVVTSDAGEIRNLDHSLRIVSV